MQFVLFAPRVQQVQLIGSWQHEPILMQKNSKGEWEVDVDLPDGKYSYQFRLESLSSFLKGKEIAVNDPLAKWIENGVAWIRVSSNDAILDEYAWCWDGVVLPANDELVIYELHVAEFGAKDGQLGTFSL